LVLDGACFGQSSFWFVDRREESGIESKHYVDETEPWLPRLMVAGVATFDYDGDGAVDLFLPSQPLAFPTDVKPAIQPDGYLGNRLYRNLGAARFADVTHPANLTSHSHTLGVVAGDLDHDGDQDLVLNNWGGVELFLNQGDGTFEKATPAQIPQSSIPSKDAPLFGAGICLLDVKNDGDWDEGGYSEVFLCSDTAPNQLLINDSGKTFADDATLRGVAFDVTGNAHGSMGVDAGDMDNDGLEDLLISNYTAQTPVHYRNLGGGLLEDASR